MPYRILINREESGLRVAFLEGQKLVELHTEKFDEQSIVNNIYRGKVQDVVPGLQAAFVDVGLERNLFLHFMDVRAESLVLGSKDQLSAMRTASEKTVSTGRIERKGRRPRQDPSAPQAAPPLKKGDDIIVQVVKDEIGGKAPRVTGNLSIAGRYLVMLPFPGQDGGVSRKIAVGQDRFRLKKLLSSLKSKDHSFIIRTAGIDQNETALQKDASNLEHIWQSILEKYKKLRAPGLVYNDHDLITRLVRDAFPADFEEVICDNSADAAEVRLHLSEIMPEKQGSVKVYSKTENILEYYGAEKQIEKSLSRKYWLKSGGYLIVDENEALSAIDVNTGRFTGKKDQEKTSLKTNLEACEAIAEQIRLRDIGGIIVIDFIDMLSRQNQERVAEELRRQIRKDRAKYAVGRIGDFGLMMLTRKRRKMSLKNQVYDECPYCKGEGMVLKLAEVFRRIKYEVLKSLASSDKSKGVVVSAHPRVVERLNSKYRLYFETVKVEHHCDIIFRSDADLHLEEFALTPIKIDSSEPLRLPSSAVLDQELPMQENIEEPEALAEDLLDVVDLQEVQDDLEDDAIIPESELLDEKNDRKNNSGKRPSRRRGQRGSRVKDKPESTQLKVEPEEPVQDPKEGSDEKEKGSRRRTRRGSRGGRDRRRQTSEQQESQEVSANPGSDASKKHLELSEKKAEELASLPKLTLPKKNTGGKLDYLESMLDQIEEQIKGIPQPKIESDTASKETPSTIEEPDKKESEEKPKKRQTRRTKKTSTTTRARKTKADAAKESTTATEPADSDASKETADKPSSKAAEKKPAGRPRKTTRKPATTTSSTARKSASKAPARKKADSEQEEPAGKKTTRAKKTSASGTSSTTKRTRSSSPRKTTRKKKTEE